jgi:transcriptional regulator with XRE-family HTH domain
MMQKSLAARLRLLRAQRGLTVKDAARQLGVDRHTLRRIELGTQEAQYPTLAKIAEGYGVPVEDLLEEPVPLGEAPGGGVGRDIRVEVRDQITVSDTVKIELKEQFDALIHELETIGLSKDAADLARMRDEIIAA